MTGISSSSWVSRITWACVLFTKTEFGFTDFSSSFSWVSGISWGHSLSTTDFSFGWNSFYVISDSKQYSTFRFITSFISDFFSTIFSGSMWWLLIQFFIFSSVSFFSNEEKNEDFQISFQILCTSHASCESISITYEVMTKTTYFLRNMSPNIKICLLFWNFCSKENGERVMLYSNPLSSL